MTRCIIPIIINIMRMEWVCQTAQHTHMAAARSLCDAILQDRLWPVTVTRSYGGHILRMDSPADRLLNWELLHAMLMVTFQVWVMYVYLNGTTETIRGWSVSQALMPTSSGPVIQYLPMVTTDTATISSKASYMFHGKAVPVAGISSGGCHAS